MNKKLCVLFSVFAIMALASCGNEKTSGNSLDDLDVDLTALSSTMVYAEVYNMMTAPESYVGKIVKMHGQFAVYEAEETGLKYFACVISDATACCQQGLEFVLSDTSLSYPDDYPTLDTEITVIGEFQTYLEDGDTYCHLANSTIL